MEDDAGYRVRLVSVASFYGAATSSGFEQVIFKASPTLQESRRVEYVPVSPVHMPGSIQIYKNTSARDFQISALLISRTQDEALQNMKQLQLLRAWCTPYFGSSSTLTDSQRGARRELTANNVDPSTYTQAQISSRGSELLGAPPDVLYLYGYAANNQRPDVSTSGSATRAQAVNIHKVPVVITSLDFTYPNDVDYIPTSDIITSPFPTKMTVNIALAETHSPAEYEKFNLADFKQGRLVNF